MGLLNVLIYGDHFAMAACFAGGAGGAAGEEPGMKRGGIRPRVRAPVRCGAGAGKIAGAPISWGVCEVPGWGYQLSPERVLAEMTQVGLAATELGPAGFLPDDPRRAASVLREHHLASVGGFVPVILHLPGHDPVPEIQNVLAGYADTGSGTLVLSADSGLTGYDARPTLDEDGWATLLRNLDRLGAVAAGHGVLAVLHPHVGTMVENGYEVQRVLEGSSVALCLDTGHLLIGGTDPAELARQVPGRIAHTHLKDVNDSDRGAGPGRADYLQRGRSGGDVPAAGHGRRGRGRDRVRAGAARVPGLVRAGAGHDPDRGAARGRTGRGRAGER